MIDFLALIKKTNAYKTIENDLSSGRLSHAYLITCAEKFFLTDYLKVFAKLILCKDCGGCGNCRRCNSIEQLLFSDLKYYPKNGENILTNDIAELVEESFFKPIEGTTKLFLIDKGQTMNLSAQNKLLKTLEEPPKNVCIIIGTNSEENILPTVKSRVKKLEIPTFSNEEIFNALIEGKDSEKLKQAISCGDGTVGKANALYDNIDLQNITNFVVDMIVNMQTSKNVIDFYNKFISLKCEIDEFLSVAELVFRDMLVNMQGNLQLVFNKNILEKVKNAQGFSQGALIYILEKITEANKRKKVNANSTMLIEWFLFAVLEGKHKWQKL